MSTQKRSHKLTMVNVANKIIHDSTEFNSHQNEVDKHFYQIMLAQDEYLKKIINNKIIRWLIMGVQNLCQMKGSKNGH